MSFQFVHNTKFLSGLKTNFKQMSYPSNLYNIWFHLQRKYQRKHSHCMQIHRKQHILGEGNFQTKSKLPAAWRWIEQEIRCQHSIAIAEHLMANISFISPEKSQTLNQESKTFRKITNKKHSFQNCMALWLYI